MIDASDPGGEILGHIDSHPRTVADDNAWDTTGLTASIGAEPEPRTRDDHERRRPSWVPVGE